MAGIIASVGMPVSVRRLGAAAQMLCHGPGFRVACHAAGDVALAAVFRENDPPSAAWMDGPSVGAVVYGHAFEAGTPGCRVDATGMVKRYLARGIDVVSDLDGSFVIAILDHNNRRLQIANDRTAAVPVKFHATPGAFVLAPEAKAICGLREAPPELDPEGALALLATGHGLGRGTLVKGIELLEPGHVLSVSLDDARCARRAYWRLRFQPDRQLAEREASAELHRRLLRSHALALGDKPAFVQLLMTGGYDSRAVLGSLAAIGRTPDECLTWGVSSSIPGSDPVLAQELASACGSPWRFLHYDADRFDEHVARWVVVSELESDNLGNCAAGHDFLYRQGSVAPVVLIGDQQLGTGGLPLGRADAWQAVIGIRPGQLGEALNGLLRPDCREEAGQKVWSRAAQALEDCPHDAPKDVQDYLGIYVRLARWLNAPTYFREPMVSVRRPMLQQPMLDLFEHLTPSLRVDKRVLVAMLRDHMPHLYRYPKAAAHSLVDWSRAFSNRDSPAGRWLGTSLEWERLMDSGVGIFLDRQALTSAVEHHFRRTAPPVNRRPKADRLLPAFRRLLGSSTIPGTALRVAEHLARRGLRRRSGPSQGVLLARLGLLAELQRAIAHGAFRAGAATAEPPTLWALPHASPR